MSYVAFFSFNLWYLFEEWVDESIESAPFDFESVAFDGFFLLHFCRFRIVCRRFVHQKSIQFKFHEFICQSLCMTNRHVYASRFVFYEENNIQIAQLRWRNFFRCQSRFFYQKKNVVVTEGNFYVFYFITKWAKARVRYNCTCTGFDVDLNLSTHQIRHMAVNWKYHTFPSIDFASAFCVTAHWRDAIHSA